MANISSDAKVVEVENTGLPHLSTFVPQSPAASESTCDSWTTPGSDDELLESTKVMQKHMRHLRFGKLKRPWCVAFQEYGYCEYEGFLTRTKRVRPDWKNTSASLQRGGGHALHASGHARLWAQGGRNCVFSNGEL